ncbi:tRNA(Ile)-lysidine synthase [Dyella jiangningensis]|uniref:tRNA lysidine(34) synthetase TilS n=1 Tax=Dyella sp. AtDHG13 TaxID=1938897 RepID=UPI00088EB7A4|nr:tRNA lysidine(34) synthetase TilS [Dyella sp. AtDHG13]PXV58667.1 tRNA(Ile)-lysidine synthase [Dyella sp. AtDHG13]SDJ87272.1 tRNA(Ile)-lysidine synthase [Dyella jiangningensis]
MTELTDVLRDALQAQPDGALCVAYSGGPDSTALLHALAQSPQTHARGLRALHVDHGLHAQSHAWAEHCRQLAREWGVPCLVLRVEVDHQRGYGLEAAAREARYHAFAASLQKGERLLLAHHRDDQAETVLLKLLRGAGPEGLGGMRATRRLGEGQLWRPLLDTPRDALRRYVERHELPCIDDPSNNDARLSRNFLRHEILPRLSQHWPQAVESIVHSARLHRSASDALEQQWRTEQARLLDPATGSLDAVGWLALTPALRHPLLDDWLHARGLTAPTTAQREQIERQCTAHDGQLPCIRWPGTELHVWKGRLWALPPRPAIDPHWQADWQGEPLALPDGGSLLLDPPARLDAPLTVRLRQGGEHLRPAGHAHTRELRDLFQQSGMPPWRRLACPLLYAGDELIGVGDRWLTERGATLLGDARPRWQPAW